tara:strand:+ start:4778 stop:4996 length:219 start_codon:yes stop_codon:yes gene_type:complete
MSWGLIPWSQLTHRKMTYQQLLDQLQELTPQQLNQTATLYSIKEDEFVPVYSGDFTDSDEQVLDANHFVITF